MRFGGVQAVSFTDYPGICAAVLFTQGCNFRCSFCHNPELVLPYLFGAPAGFQQIEPFLCSRRGKLDGIVISGGEPTLHSDLPDIAGAIKAMGFAVKVDTNGSDPRMLGRLLAAGVIDCVAMDVKAPYAKYGRVAGVGVDTRAIRESIALIRASGISRVFRTTYDPASLDPGDIAGIEAMLGGDPLMVQEFRLLPGKRLLGEHMVWNGNCADISGCIR